MNGALRDFRDSLGYTAWVILIAVIVVFGGGLLTIVYLNTLGVATQNAQRNVTTHSQQYVQTQQQVLVNLYSDYVAAPDDAHKQASALRICAQAAMLDPVEYPDQVAPFIAQNCH